MGKDRLGQFMKEKVYNHQTPTDLDALWQGIQAKQKIERQPKRRMFVWFFFCTGIMLIGSLTIYFLFVNVEGENQSAKPIPIQQWDEVIDIAELKSEEFDFDAGQVVVAENENNKTTVSEFNTNSKVNPNVISELGTKENLNKKLNVTSPIILQDKLVNTYSTAIENKIIISTELDKTSELISIKAFKKENLSSSSKKEMNNELRQITLLANIEELASKTEGEIHPSSFNRAPIAKALNNSSFSIGVFFDYGFSIRQLNGSAEEYLNRRNDQENAEQVISGGVDFKYQVKSGLFIKSGIQYEQITERLDINRIGDLETFYNENGPRVIYKLVDGSIDTIYGTNSTRQSIQKGKVYNRYRMMDLSLLAGYHPMSNNRLSWFAEGGILMNLAFIPQGQIMDINDETIIDLSDTDIFKRNIGLSLNLGLGLSYRLNENWSLWLSPRFRYALSTMTKSNYALEQSFSRGAMQLGIRKGL